jgi:general secretion pathway protein G
MFVTGENGEDWTKPDGWNGPYLERWPSKNPWGGTYTFKKDASTWDSDDKEERYLELTQVPESAFPILQRDLGNDSVKRESTTKTTVRIIISNDD